MTTTSLTAFPSSDDIAALAQSDYERDFLALEFGPGFDYYLSRLDRLLLSGEALLDAGCGAGQWALAGSQRFGRVEALDVSPERLAVLRAVAKRMGTTNVTARQGAIESLPYEPASFDAVICYGVIMFTQIEAVLAEFFRVLRPGGRAYLCLNADGWNRYLVRERGQIDPKVRDAGCQTLYNTHWRRASAAGVDVQIRRAVSELEQLWPASLGPRMRAWLLRADDRGWGTARRAANAIATYCLRTGDPGLTLMKAVADDCGPSYSDRLLGEVWQLLRVGQRPPRQIPAESYLPAELRSLATVAGFVGFQWAIEAGITCDWLTPPPTPKYAGYYAGELAVWEALLVKPGALPLPAASISQHLSAGRVAREERLFVEPASQTVLSNASWDAFPQELAGYAKRMAGHLGGSSYLEKVAHAVVAGATSDETRVRRLIEFTQRSIFRDPISQPLGPDGGDPDALTILLSARGRCSHTSVLLVALFRSCGFDSRLRQLANHVVAEVRIDGRWILADADAFKNGVIPVNRSGALLTMDDLRDDPWQIDRFQPTGWWIREGSRFARGVRGGTVRGYVDALDPDQRGFVSGYYVPAVKASPPGIPAITRFEIRDGRLVLEWTPSRVPSGVRLAGYRVAIGSTSRGWSYEQPAEGDEILRPPSGDLVRLQTAETRLEVAEPSDHRPLFAAVTAISDQIEREPDTYFWPSVEVSHGS